MSQNSEESEERDPSYFATPPAHQPYQPHPPEPHFSPPHLHDEQQAQPPPPPDSSARLPYGSEFDMTEILRAEQDKKHRLQVAALKSEIARLERENRRLLVGKVRSPHTNYPPFSGWTTLTASWAHPSKMRCTLVIKARVILKLGRDLRPWVRYCNTHGLCKTCGSNNLRLPTGNTHTPDCPFQTAADDFLNVAVMLGSGQSAQRVCVDFDMMVPMTDDMLEDKLQVLVKQDGYRYRLNSATDF